MLAPRLDGQVSPAAGLGLMPVVSTHVGAAPVLFGLDEQPVEQMSPLIGRQYLNGAGATFCRWTMRKGAVVPLHHHVNEQITWITQGRAEVFSQGQRFVMTAGTLLIIPSNVPHEFVFTEDTIDIDIFTPSARTGSMIWRATTRADLSNISRRSSMTTHATASHGRFDVAAIASSLPETASTLLVDHYLTDEAAASARVFRVYRGTPPHYHATCDEYLYVLSGRGTFWMESAEAQHEFRPGQLLFFKRGTVHALPEILEGPVIFLSVDTPRRDPKDIVFVDPADGTPESFIRQQAM